MWIALASALALQDRYTIEGTAREATLEEKGARRPVFRCEGTSNLPEGSRLDVKVYYGAVQIGRHLHFKALFLREGKFAIDLAVFPDRTPAGSYSVHVDFNPYQQQQEIQEKMGRQLRPYSAVLPATIGTEADAAEDRRRACARLGAAVERLRIIVDSAEMKLLEQPTVEEWQRITRCWSEDAHQVEKSLLGVLEFKVFSLDDVSEQNFEDLVRCVQLILESGESRLKDPKNENAVRSLGEYRKIFDRLRRQTLLRLGLASSTNRELAEAISGIRPILSELLPLYRTARKDPSFQNEGYLKAKIGVARKNLRERILPACETAPDRHREGLRGLLEQAMEFFRVLADATENLKEDRAKPVGEALAEFDRRHRALEEALKE